MNSTTKDSGFYIQGYTVELPFPFPNGVIAAYSNINPGENGLQIGGVAAVSQSQVTIEVDSGATFQNIPVSLFVIGW